MQTWSKAAGVTIVSAVGMSFAATSLLGNDEPLPDVGGPVVLESSGEGPETIQPAPGLAGSGADDADSSDGQVVHPRPWGERARNREDRDERRAVREDRRQLREQQREQREGARDDAGDDDEGDNDVADDDAADDDAADDDAGDNGAGDDDAADDDEGYEGDDDD